MATTPTDAPLATDDTPDAEPPPTASSDIKTALGMATPATIGLVLFVIVPFGLAIWLSFQNLKLNSARPAEFFGFEQYRRVLLDPDFRGDFYAGLRNNLLFAAVVVPLQTSLAVLLALVLNRKLRGMAFYRTFIFMPIVFPMALVAVMWRLIYSRSETGMLNAALDFVTFGQVGPIDWLGSSSWALISIIILSMWQGVGFQTIIVLAGLQGISPTLYEAASIDKASTVRQFRHVTLPGLRNTLIFVVMVTTIFSFRLFDQVYILTKGGPDNSTTTLMYQAVDNAFVKNNVGRGAAITVLLFLMVVLITIVQRRFLKEERAIS
ncbi:carbohydrate ABC transporter permease [Actinospongicola halichondriae]|uniref:carbohydrate ABC transporter permease n=1 Tax=Actinospongicola halichondriae TaxID=3236844 RepID=UPI003D4AD8DD